MVEWKKRDVKAPGNVWLPKVKGEELAGEITKVADGKFGPQWTIMKEDESEVLTPSHKVLQNRMEGLAVGEVVKIVYLGQEPPAVRGQNPMQMYEVYTA